MQAIGKFISIHRRKIGGLFSRARFLAPNAGTIGITKQFMFIGAALVLAMAISGCVKISGSLKKIGGVNDFARTQFVVNGGAPADGVTGLLVGLQLKNSDNSAIASYTPQYEVVAGQALPVSTCTESDKNGISACILRSTVPGTKTIALTNAKVGLKQDLVFSSPGNAKVLNTISASAVNLPTTAGSHVNLSLGDPKQGISRSTQGGFKVMFTAVGAGITQ